MKNSQQWKKFLALVLCIVQCMVLLVPVANAQEADPEAMSATSVAVPEQQMSEVSTTVTMQEESSYWWGIASQATATIGDPITGISDRYSVIFDSPIEEGYGNGGKTSSYFEVNADWADFDIYNQDLMFYIELPEAASSIRFKHICLDWNWPRPGGMTYEYLEADGRKWIQGTIDANYQVDLTPGFKGFVRVQVDTAPNLADCGEMKNLQYFGFRISDFGGSYGAAKLGGVWFVDKGEAYQVSVDGGETVALTTADPLPVPGEGDEFTWNGDVLTANVAKSEGNADGEASSWVSRSGDNPSWSGIATQSVVTVTDSLQVLGMPAAAVIDSPIKEGYFEESGKTYPNFMMNIQWANITPSKQDVMFYIELPEVSSSIRLISFCIKDWAVYLNRSGMQYQYLSMDSREWQSGVIDGNDQIDLTYGFKGFVRLMPSTATNIGDYIDQQMGANNLQFRLDRFGGENGPVKIGGAWIVSKEDTRYIKIGDGETICMTNPVEPTWIQAAAAFKEDGTVGQAAVNTKFTDKGWGRTPLATMTVGECINPLNDGQKSIIIDSEQHEGYTLDDSTERTYPSFHFNANNPTVDMANNEIMFYVELPERASSVRIDGLTFICEGSYLTPGMGNMQYSYLPIDGSQWIDGGLSDGNYHFQLTSGFKGYVRLNMTDVPGWWWQNHASGDAAWKTSTATFNLMELRYERFGADLGQAKFGGLWIVDKADFIDASVDGADAKAMTSYVFVDPVLNAVSVAVENPEKLWDSKVTLTGDTQAQITVADAITKISDRKAVVINSEAAEGYSSSVSPEINVHINAAIDAAAQDIMFYVELPAAAQGLQVAVDATTFKYLAVDAGNWLEGAVSENGQIDLPAGFKGYIRLAVNANNVDTLTFQVDAFGGDLGAFKLGGVWFVSKTEGVMVSVDGADAVALGYLTDPVGNVEQWNVVLQDDIAVNFYVRVNANILDTAEIAITFNGKTVSSPVAELSAAADGTYCVKTDVAAAQMNDTITVQVTNGDDVSAEQTYTVAQYAKTLLSDETMSGYYRLVKEMLNYGGMAQLYFGYNTDHLANEGLIGVGANAIPAEAETEMTVTGAAEGVQVRGVTLVCRNKVAVRYYFNVSGDVSDRTFTCNAQPCEPVAKDGMYYVEIDGINPQDLNKSITVTVDDALSVSYSPMNYMVRMNAKGSDELKALLRAMYNYHLAAKQVVLAQDDPARYDLKVTTFNVGQWYHGVSNLDVYGAQVNAHPGITPDHVLRAYDQWMAALPMHDADVICAQEMRDIFYINNQNNEDASDDVILTAEEVLDDYFQVNSFTGATTNGTVPMWMGMLTPNSGRYQLKNITAGHLCEDIPKYARAYMKGYITVNGHDIAIYCVHLQPTATDGNYRELAYQELIEMAKQDEYVIIMGDMNAGNGPEEYEIMTEAGFSMANCGRFGAFDTYEYREVDAIDNIFVTSNIEIAYAEAEPDKVGGSDHYPMSAYLMIKDEA